MKADYRGLMYSIETSIGKKESLFTQSKARYFVRAVLACLFLTIGTAIAVIIGQLSEELIPDSGKILYSFMFSWSLVMIIFMNAELGTSNMMYMTTAVHRKLLHPKTALSILFFCMLFNLVGGILASFMMSFTSVFQNLPADHFLFTAVTGKLAKTPVRIFVEGIFANTVVNIAIFCTMRMKDDAAKVISMIFIIFIFAFLGFEHIIANFSSFPLAFFASGGTVPGMTVGSVLVNWLFAALGNYVGGGLLIGLTYSWLNNERLAYLD